ncbi:serine hydrolase [Microbaculum marinum]|uniref:Serine hydrolase n=1 Tax=Microbaculum marinum TaxID=1764581 RepID=A0AAW9RYW2_9HYPH
MHSTRLPFADASGRLSRILLPLVLTVAFASPTIPARADDDVPGFVAEIVPELEEYISQGMSSFDLPGLAVGIVTGDKLVYAKGFGTRRKGGEPVDTKTVFQIGSTSKAFLATMLAISVDRGDFKWDDRVVDIDPTFQMKDPWVTQEFRVFDIISQRSGLPPYVNDIFSMLGFDRTAMIRSLRFVEPRTSFRSTFSYTNLTHLVAGGIVTRAAGAEDWEAALRSEIFEPLGMDDSSASAAGIEAAPNHAVGHRWTADGTVEVPFTHLFPYNLDGAGAINSNVEDMAQWLRLQLADGKFDGDEIVSKENLAATRVPRVGLSDTYSYAMGWGLQSTPNGEIIWHNGGTLSFGAFVGILPSRNAGIVVLSNETNMGFPDAVGLWVLDRFLGNPEIDYAAQKLNAAKALGETASAQQDASAGQRSPMPFEQLAGDYRNDAMGPVTVTQEGDALAVAFTTGASITLTPWREDVFAATLAPVSGFETISESLGPDPIAFAQFQIDGSGSHNLLRLSMEDGQSYVFTRVRSASEEGSGE